MKDLCRSKLENTGAFCIPPFAVHEMGKFRSTVKRKNLTGPENILPYLHKIALPCIVDSMTYVYNLCIKQNVLPTALENAKVVPVPQSNDLSDSCNYIPIYVLPVLSKPLERHIHKHLLQYLENKKTHSPVSIWILSGSFLPYCPNEIL